MNEIYTIFFPTGAPRVALEDARKTDQPWWFVARKRPLGCEGPLRHHSELPHPPTSDHTHPHAPTRTHTRPSPGLLQYVPGQAPDLVVRQPLGERAGALRSASLSKSRHRATSFINYVVQLIGSVQTVFLQVGQSEGGVPLDDIAPTSVAAGAAVLKHLEGRIRGSEGRRGSEEGHAKR